MLINKLILLQKLIVRHDGPTSCKTARKMWIARHFENIFDKKIVCSIEFPHTKINYVRIAYIFSNNLTNKSPSWNLIGFR